MCSWLGSTCAPVSWWASSFCHVSPASPFWDCPFRARRTAVRFGEGIPFWLRFPESQAAVWTSVLPPACSVAILSNSCSVRWGAIAPNEVAKSFGPNSSWRKGKNNPPQTWRLLLGLSIHQRGVVIWFGFRKCHKWQGTWIEVADLHAHWKNFPGITTITKLPLSRNYHDHNRTTITKSQLSQHHHYHSITTITKSPLPQHHHYHNITTTTIPPLSTITTIPPLSQQYRHYHNITTITQSPQSQHHHYHNITTITTSPLSPQYHHYHNNITTITTISPLSQHHHYHNITTTTTSPQSQHHHYHKKRKSGTKASFSHLPVSLFEGSLTVSHLPLSDFEESCTKASVSHLPLSLFEGGLARKLRFHIFTFHFWREVSHEMRFWKLAEAQNVVFCRTKRVSGDGWEACPADGCGARSFKPGSWSDRPRCGTASSGVVLPTLLHVVLLCLATQSRNAIVFCSWTS